MSTVTLTESQVLRLLIQSSIRELGKAKTLSTYLFNMVNPKVPFLPLDGRVINPSVHPELFKIYPPCRLPVSPGHWVVALPNMPMPVGVIFHIIKDIAI